MVKTSIYFMLFQAIIYSLTVASKGTEEQMKVANKLLQKMCQHSNKLVQQAIMVSKKTCFVVFFVLKS